MDVGKPFDYLKAKLDRSKEDLDDARDLFQQGKYRLSVNRAYYGVFHIVSEPWQLWVMPAPNIPGWRRLFIST